MDRRRIVWNSSFLAIRTVLAVVISLFLSRVLLKNLGVEDFGIYGLVGSAVAFWSSLQGVFASATQRFLNVAQVSSDPGRAARVFSVALFVDMIVALIFLILVGAVGSYLIEYVFQIDQESLPAARIVFWFTMLGTVFTIITLPFESALLSHERMGIIALLMVSIHVARLVVACLLPYASIDALVFYGLGLCVATVGIRLIYVYCAWKICPEVRFRPRLYRDLTGEMLRFAGWQSLGNTAYAAVKEGLNFMLNIFWGPALNAARAIAVQVQGLLSQSVGNISTAAYPQFCMLYELQQRGQFLSLFSIICRTVFFFSLALCLPILACLDGILGLWLTEIPPYTTTLIPPILMYAVVRAIHDPINALFLVSGRIKRYQVTEAIILSTSLLFSLIALQLYDFPPAIIYYIMLVVELVNFVFIVRLARREVNFSLRFFARSVLLRIFLVLAASLVYFFIEWYFLRGGFWFWRGLRVGVVTLGLSALLGFEPREIRRGMDIGLRFLARLGLRRG